MFLSFIILNLVPAHEIISYQFKWNLKNFIADKNWIQASHSHLGEIFRFLSTVGFMPLGFSLFGSLKVIMHHTKILFVNNTP